MRRIRSLFSVVPDDSLEAKWIPHDERKRIRDYCRKSVPGDREVDIDVKQYGDGYAALMGCRLGSSSITCWLLPVIQDQDLAASWQELAGLAAGIVGISNPAHIHQLTQVASGLEVGMDSCCMSAISSPGASGQHFNLR